jgi:hypothetical protein
VIRRTVKQILRVGLRWDCAAILLLQPAWPSNKGPPQKSLFDDNPAVKRVFCPPKQAYDPVANADGRYGKPPPPFRDLIESGIVCALNLPLSANPGLARTIGTMMKQDFQRAALNRIPQIVAIATSIWRFLFAIAFSTAALASR